jgi:hypothetical protein
MQVWIFRRLRVSPLVPAIWFQQESNSNAETNQDEQKHCCKKDLLVTWRLVEAWSKVPLTSSNDSDGIVTRRPRSTTLVLPVIRYSASSKFQEIRKVALKFTSRCMQLVGLSWRGISKQNLQKWHLEYPEFQEKLNYALLQRSICWKWCCDEVRP